MNNTIDIAPYMKYYIGCKCITEFDGMEILTSRQYAHYHKNDCLDTIKPILRRLSSMTDEEKVELYDFMWPGEISVAKVLPLKYLYRIVDNIITTRLYNPKIFHWLISKGFWLFGDEYFDAGLILELQQKVK